MAASEKSLAALLFALIDNNGAVVVEYKYDAWGNHEAEVASEEYVTLANLNPYRYRGYYFDEETSLYFLQTRYYDPVVGRFISRDSIEYADPETICGLNLYVYCGNNPVMYIDPTGLAAIAATIAILGIFGIIIVGAVAIESEYHIIGNFVDIVIASIIDIFYSTNSIEAEAIQPYTNNLYWDQAGRRLDLHEDILIDCTQLPTILYNHRNNSRPSTKDKHERGLATDKRNKPGGEKGDARRPFRRNGKSLKYVLRYIYLLLIALIYRRLL